MENMWKDHSAYKV